MVKNTGFYLVIAGNIGVGKTTLTQLIREQIGWRSIDENVENNPYLEWFYQDMNRWAFHSQIYFLSQRFKAHLEINQMDEPVCQDRSIYEDAEVFTTNLYNQGILPERDYATYLDLYESMIEELRPPDLIVYLRASPWTLLSRIRKRWRDIERNVDKEYLFQLNLAYEKWLKRWQKENPVLTIETDGRDLLTEKEWTNNIIDQIKKLYKQKILEKN